MQEYIFKGDKWNRAYGTLIPAGARVSVLRYCYRRRVLIEYAGKRILTMLWCIKKIAKEQE